MTTDQPTEFRHWRTSRHSHGGGNSECVEVGRGPAAVGVRDSKNPAAGILRFSPPAWAAFLRRLG